MLFDKKKSYLVKETINNNYHYNYLIYLHYILAAFEYM